MRNYLLLFLVLLSGVSEAQEGTGQTIPVMLGKLPAARSDTARMRLLLAIADEYVSKPGKDKIDLDSAILLINQVEKSNAAINDVRIKGVARRIAADAVYEQGFVDSAKTQTLTAIDILGKMAPGEDWAVACFQAAFYYPFGDPHGDSMRVFYFRKAISGYVAAGNKDRQAWCLRFLSDCLMDLKAADAVAPMLEALEIYRSLNSKEDLGSLYSKLGDIYSELGDQRQAMHYCQLALRIQESQPKVTKATMLAYARMGGCYYNQGNSREAIPYFRKALDLVKQLKDTANIQVYGSNVVNANVVIGDYAAALAVLREVAAFYPPRTLMAQVHGAESFAQVFGKLNRLDSMGVYVDRLMAWDRNLMPNDGLRFHTLTISVFYWNRTGQYALVKKYGGEIVRLGALRGNMNVIYVGYRELSRADSALGNYKDALGEYKKYITMKDSIHDVNNTKEVAALKLQYETEKKDMNIKDLNHKQEISLLALRQAGVTRDFIIAGAVLLLLLLLVFINRFRLKQRTTKKLELQQREIAQQNDSLHQLVNEKDWLLKEIHHRVKNNLQVVMSLLNSQSIYIDNAAALTAINDSRHRVYAMSLIHQKLYKSENVASLDMSVYVRELVSYLCSSFDTGQRIRFELDVAPFAMDVNQAVPFGLILNEAVTNSIKYAFPDGRDGVISISLSNTDPDHYLLSISDDGIGLPAHFDDKKTGSLGMTLMKGLSRNLEGLFSIESKNGTVIKIAFGRDPGIKVSGMVA